MAVSFITDPAFFVEVEEQQLEFPLDFPLTWDTGVVVATADFPPSGDTTYLSSGDASFIT